MIQITAEEVLARLTGDGQMAMLVCYASGEAAMRSTVADVAVLARRKMVYGVVKKNRLVSVRLAVSIRAACRTLNVLRLSSQARQGTMTSKRSTGLRNSECVNTSRADLGITGSRRQVWIREAVA